VPQLERHQKLLHRQQQAAAHQGQVARVLHRNVV
jgi:hypothetical protein